MGKTITFQTTMVIEEDDLVNLLSNAMETPEDCGCAWYKPTDQKAYDEAKAQLISERKPDADDQIRQAAHERRHAAAARSGIRLALVRP